MDAQGVQRLSNCISVLEAVEKAGLISRKQISDETGLSLMTVGKLCTLLEECELISEKKEDKSESGRKAAICSLTKNCRPCVFNCADKIYMFTAKGPVGRPDISLIHASPDDIGFEDKLFQFCDRMNDMLERIEHTEPSSICIVSDAKDENGILTTSDGSHANIKRIVQKLCKTGSYSVFAPASAAAAYLEKNVSEPSVAAVIGKTLNFAVVGDSPIRYDSRAIYPTALRADGVSLGERLQMMGTPDKESVLAFFSALAAFFPDRRIVIFPLAESNGMLTCGELCRFAISSAGIENRCTTCEDPLGAIAEGAKLMYMTELLKKHI
ncbi:MAG: hypothetical protein IJF74_06115 [Clostridia bacterium]|nr:hypothetical protein [Clostridia bacterium]